MPVRSRSPRLRLAWLAYLAGCAIAACEPRDPKAPPPLPEAVTFVKAPPRIGRVSVEESTTEFHLSTAVNADGGAVSRVRTESLERERWREEVLGVFDRIVVKKRVTYELLDRSEERNGQRSTSPPSSLVGRSYLVELKESVPVFAYAAGGEVSDQERRELSRRFATFGKPDPFLEGLPSGPVHPGLPTSGMAAGFLEMFDVTGDMNSEGPDVAKVDVRFAGVREESQGRCGVFAFAMNVQVSGEPRLFLDLTGEFLVRVADGVPVKLEASGPARLVGAEVVEGVNVELKGSGKMTSTLRITYL